MTTGPSLRRRLVLGVVAGLVLLQVLSCLAVYWLQRRMLYDRFDQSLIATARALVPLIRHDEKKGLHFDHEHQPLPEFQREAGPDYFQLWVREGRIVAKSRTLGERELARSPATSDRGLPLIYELDLPENGHGHAAALALEIPMKGPPERRGPPAPVVLMVAKSTGGIEADLRMLAWTLAGTAAGITLVAGLVGWMVVSGGLRPLRRLSEQIAAIHSDRLNQPLPAGSQPIEIRPVVQRLNEMLDRLRAAFERERSFTADVAHELRTPLAGIRSVVEVALSGTQDSAEYRRDLEEVLGMAAGMQATVEKLLTLARMDAGQVRLDPVAVAVVDIIKPALELRQDKITRRRLSVGLDLPVGAIVWADLDLLCMIVGNLLDNACEYADEGGRITISADRRADHILLVFANTGCALSPQQVAGAFARFWRDETARSATGHHAGLGLSLVERAAAIMGGSAVAAMPEPAVFAVTVALLAAPATTRTAVPDDRRRSTEPSPAPALSGSPKLSIERG